VMEAQVVQEIWHGLELIHSSVQCSACSQKITKQEARYTCQPCAIEYCTTCTADMIKLPRLREASPHSGVDQNGFVPGHIGIGDIFLVGPDRWGIHHVVLVCGSLEYDPAAANILCPNPDEDVFSCLTIESSQEIQGKNIPWYAGRSFYTRHRITGAARHVGDMEEGTRAISKVLEPSPVKVLLHPCRPGHGGPAFHAKLFEDGAQALAGVSRDWGLNTAFSAFTSRRECLDLASYPDAESRKVLLKELRERWSRPPICSSVAIMVWQNYFLASCSDREDLAVQHILHWIPVFSDQTMPSMLLRVLTRHGWILRGNLDY